MSKMDVVVPVKLTLDSKFKFRCHKAIKCFTKCCSNIDILLTPYDILKLKNRLRLSSGEFLSKYTYVKIDENSSLPHVILKMTDDKKRTIKSWRIHQEVNVYDEMNRDWKAMQLRKNTQAQDELNENKQAQVYMACYDVDGFRRFVFESRFLDIFDIENKVIERIKA